MNLITDCCDLRARPTSSARAMYAFGWMWEWGRDNYAAAGCGSGAKMPRTVLLPAAQPGHNENSSLTMQAALSTGLAECCSVPTTERGNCKSV